MIYCSWYLHIQNQLFEIYHVLQETTLTSLASEINHMRPPNASGISFPDDDGKACPTIASLPELKEIADNKKMQEVSNKLGNVLVDIKVGNLIWLIRTYLICECVIWFASWM